ncbi:MAG: ATP-binding protein [Chloroflexota bacterium]|nr:ATP-binding protein [Chloroflexota bacterium]
MPLRVSSADYRLPPKEHRSLTTSLRLNEIVLFTCFYRADNVELQNISGMGIGLFVVKEIISLHGGTIEVASQESQDNTFTICLPLAAAASGPQLVENMQAY